jgi:Ion channel
VSTASGGPHPGESSIEERGAEYRYGIVFLLVFAVAVVLILTPDGQGWRAFSFALTSAALITAVSTSRAPSGVRHRRFTIGTAVTAVITVLIATGVIDREVSLALGALLALAVPFSLGRGLVRLVRERGATVQAVAGALAIYLLLGLAFASAIGFAAQVGPGDFYAEGTNGSTSQHVYYSFTVLTTTGFGDLTAAHRVGRALAMVEMLVGQIYLVTVIGILIGRRSSGPAAPAAAAAAGDGPPPPPG